MRIVLGILLLLVSPSVYADARLVKDIGQGSQPVSSKPIPLSTVGNDTFYIGWENGTGTELWKTDGTAAGTKLVRDFAPGPASGMPALRLPSRAVGKQLVFLNGDAAHGVECWVSDGTATGTRMLRDINPGPENSLIRFGEVAGSLLYFTAYSPDTGRELWRTDGTPEGTRFVVDLMPGLQTSSPQMLSALGNRMLFSASNGTENGIFITNETGDGADFVASQPGEYGVALGSDVLFAVPDTSRKSWSLVRTDGTATGTVVIRTGLTADPGVSFAAGEHLAYFIAGATANEVWRTDGTASGTLMLKTANPGLVYTSIATIGDRALFITNLAGGQIWSSDGTVSSTRLVTEALTSDGVVYDGYYYYSNKDHAHGRELWRTDGTPAGTSLVRDISPGVADGLESQAVLAVRPDGVLFAASEPVTGTEPWISDGSSEGARMIANVARDAARGSTPSMLGQAGDRVVFFTPDGADYFFGPSTLWSSDGTDAGTVAIQQVETLPVRGVSSAGLFYFVTGTAAELILWRTDGTAAGTWRLHRSPQRMHSLQPWRHGLFFNSRDAEGNERPFFSDGSVAGTHAIANVAAKEPVVAGDWVYFSAVSAATQREIPWRTDGTSAGIPLISVSDASGNNPKAFTAAGEWVYFVAASSTGGFELWRSNVVSGQTSIVTTIAGFEGPNVMWPLGNLVVFRVHDGWWRSDGTAAGTFLFSPDAAPMFCSAAGAGAVTDGRILYWYGNEYAAGAGAPSLWRSDGSAAGTYPLAPIGVPAVFPGKRCETNGLALSEGRLYFHGYDPAFGGEPWVTDGTRGGTRMLTDLNPSYLVSNAGAFLAVGKTLFFTAQRQDTGDELWSLCVDDCGARRRAVRP